MKMNHVRETVVGRNVKVARTMRGWTQAELIDRCVPRISSGRIVQIERGYRHRPPTEDEIGQLARALDVDIAVLTNPLPQLPPFAGSARAPRRGAR